MMSPFSLRSTTTLVKPRGPPCTPHWAGIARRFARPAFALAPSTMLISDLTFLDWGGFVSRPLIGTIVGKGPAGVREARHATTGWWVCDAGRSSGAPRDQALPAGWARSAQHQCRGEDQGAAAGQGATLGCEVEYRSGGEQVQVLLHRAARPRHPERVPRSGPIGLTSRSGLGVWYPGGSWNRDGTAGDLCARRAATVRTRGGPLVLAGNPGGQQRTAPGLEHTPGKITRRYQQVRLTIQGGQRPAQSSLRRWVASPMTGDHGRLTPAGLAAV